ncbi:MAG: hypothetical protein FWE36_07070 [Erysipelotrichales bacterium]|nr:hypothetical protein [Erysipelotrichales bacterium]
MNKLEKRLGKSENFRKKDKKYPKLSKYFFEVSDEQYEKYKHSLRKKFIIKKAQLLLRLY